MESVTQPAPGATAGTAPIVDAEDVGFVPMHRLPPAERARNKAQMDRILDLLEEEERVVEGRNEARDRQQRREELEQRRANAKAELERIKAMKDMQKKMGKALLRNMADAREKEEHATAQQMREDMELEEARRSRKPRKCVSWAELPKSEKPSAGSNEDDIWDADGAGPSRRLPMRPEVVERFPTRPISCPSPPPPDPDSDDESDPPSDSDEGDEPHSDRIPSPGPEPCLSDDTGDGDEDEPAEGHGSEDEFDIDTVQHQREIALAYFEKRNKIGADAARAMSAHSHEPPDADEWDQEASPSVRVLLSGVLTEAHEQDVPLDATLAGPRPKPPQSKFKSERLTQTHVPSTMPSTSLGTSVIPSTSIALRHAVRTGKLEGDYLDVSGGHSSDDDVDSDDDAARVEALVEALRRRDATSAGAEENADALVAALESAYGAPPTTVTTPAPVPVPAPAARQQKDSKFKLVRAAAPPRTLAADDEGPREGAVATPPRALPTSNTVFERKRPSTQSQPPPPPMATIDPPPASVGSPAHITVIDSPSFPPPRRPTRPPTVLPTSGLVRESPGGRGVAVQQQQQAEAAAPSTGPGKKISRFKAQQTES